MGSLSDKAMQALFKSVREAKKGVENLLQ